MATAREVIMDVLRLDGEMQTYLAGGVWPRPLKMGHRADLGDTPGAFEPTGVVKPAAVVSLFGVGQSLAGTSLLSQLGSRAPIQRQAGTITFYQPRPNRDVIEKALKRARQLFDYRHMMTDDLGCIIVRASGNLGDNPGATATSDGFEAEEDRLNLDITSMRGGV